MEPRDLLDIAEAGIQATNFVNFHSALSQRVENDGDPKQMRSQKSPMCASHALVRRMYPEW